MPIYWSSFERIEKEIENNTELKNAAHKELKKLFPNLKTYKVVKDLEGNIINVIKNK